MATGFNMTRAAALPTAMRQRRLLRTPQPAPIRVGKFQGGTAMKDAPGLFYDSEGKCLMKGKM